MCGCVGGFEGAVEKLRSVADGTVPGLGRVQCVRSATGCCCSAVQSWSQSGGGKLRVEIWANYPGILFLEPPCLPMAWGHGEEVLIGTSDVTITNRCGVALPNLPVMLPVFPTGLGDITQQLNQSELAVLLNLLQSQTDLSVPQMAQLLNVHSNPEMQQQLEALNQSINALTEATTQQHETQAAATAAAAAAAEEAIEEPPAEAQLPEEQATPETAGAQGDMQNVLAVLLSQLMKSQEPVITLEESNGEKSSEQRGPRKTPTVHPEESTGK